jgi:lipid A 4'-phosphatase
LTDPLDSPEIPAKRTGSQHHRWLAPGSPALISDPLVQCAILIVVTSVFFLLFPRTDLWFSDLFYESGNGFPMNRLGAFITLRKLGNSLTWLVAVGLALVLLVKLVLPWRTSLVAPRDTLFILSTLALGPGLVVNLIFKNHWGRPRPTAIGYFNGDQPFVGVWQISDGCASNCSFVSGEASSAIWLLTLAVLVPPRWRGLAVKILIGLAVLLSLNRIAMGGHFLSDVLLSWWMTLALIAIAYRVLYVSPPQVLTHERLEDALTRAGQAIRRLFAKAPV